MRFKELPFYITFSPFYQFLKTGFLEKKDQLFLTENPYFCTFLKNSTISFAFYGKFAINWSQNTFQTRNIMKLASKHNKTPGYLRDILRPPAC